jgi:hypothetical protein
MRVCTSRRHPEKRGIPAFGGIAAGFLIYYFPQDSGLDEKIDIVRLTSDWKITTQDIK